MERMIIFEPMFKKFGILSFLLFASFGLKAQIAFNNPEENMIRFYQHNYYSQECGFTVPEEINTTLYDTIVNWLGTPYRFAGNSGHGIDCSGFVTVLYDRVYGKNLGARNSAEIYNLLEKIDKDDLKEGDLVFFRIGRRRSVSHIGLYLGNDKFVHSSTSRGVIISDLNEPYYKRYFAGAGRQRSLDVIGSTDTH